MTKAQTYYEILKTEWSKRLSRNPRYSLRAFARDLGWSPSTLSEVLNGKKGLSPKAAQEASIRLGLSEKDRLHFVTLVQSQCGRSENKKQNAREKLKELQAAWQGSTILAVDAFQLVSDWYPMAILELIRMPVFKQDVKTYARELGINVVQVEDALIRLERLEIISKNSKGKWIVEKDTVLSSDGIPSEGIKKFHEQILKRAIDALYMMPVPERDFISFVMAIRSCDLPKMRKKVRNFIEELNNSYSINPQFTDELDQIVTVSNQIIPLTRALKQGETK